MNVGSFNYRFKKQEKAILKKLALQNLLTHNYRR